MTTFYHKSKRNHSLEITVIYILMLISAVFSALLPYFLTQAAMSSGLIP